MTRVTDDELERMVMMCASDVTDDCRALLGDAIRAELLALRKVADAAVKFHMADVDSEAEPYYDMVLALIEAGAL
jgi:hypothetical protein